MKQTLEEAAQTIFRHKRERRQSLAALPIEEKIQILIRLQEIAGEISWAARGVKRQPWKTD
jgi:hypothetical protein